MFKKSVHIVDGITCVYLLSSSRSHIRVDAILNVPAIITAIFIAERHIYGFNIYEVKIHFSVNWEPFFIGPSFDLNVDLISGRCLCMHIMLMIFPRQPVNVFISFYAIDWADGSDVKKRQHVRNREQNHRIIAR